MCSKTNASLFTSLLLTANAVAQVHTHGDVVGSVTSDSAVVWTRASTTALMSVRYDTSPGMGNAVETTAITLTSQTDFAGRIQILQLLPDTLYYYATVLANPANPTSRLVGPTGSFRTAPLPGQVAPVRFAFGADIHDSSQYSIFSAIAAHQPSFFVCLGDFPYADASPAANSVSEYRQKHKQVRTSSLLWSFLRTHPIFAVWDDHEVKNNWDGATNPTNVANGIQVWHEYFPLPPGATEIYGSVRWGALTELFLLDTRKYRAINADPVVPGKPMLGTVQKTWLKNALKASTATFKLIVTSVPLRYGTTGKDHWEGYMHERREIFDWILDEEILGVVFLAGDQHWAAVHHHREGFREYQACPLATGTRTPEAIPDPEVRFIGVERSYGIVQVSPGAPPTLTVEIHGTGGLLTSETIAAELPARVRVTADETDSAFVFEGPQFFRNGGRDVRIPRVEPGSYELSFDSAQDRGEIPADLSLSIPPGAEVSIATSWRDAEDPAHPVLLETSFESPLTGFSIIDQGTITPPSSWFTDNGYLYQTSNIYGGSSAASVPDKPGTMAVTGSTLWTDVTLQTSMRSEDNDGCGLVFRYRDPQNYYRFAMDSERSFRRITKTVQGVTTILAQDGVAYDKWRWYDVRVIAVGDRLDIYIDGVKILSTNDSAFGTGAVGFYTWGNSLTSYDYLQVTAGEVLPSGARVAFADDFEDGFPLGWTIRDQGTISAPSIWREQGGVFEQTSNIYGGSMSGTVIPKPGTTAHAGSTAWRDYALAVRMRNDDDDGIGAVFRYVDPDNHYRFSMDSQRGYRRLAKVTNGQWNVLHEDQGGYSVGSWHQVRCDATGRELRVYVDGQLFAQVQDGDHPSGAIGLYCWGSDQAAFDDVVVTLPPGRRAVFAGVSAGGIVDLFGRAPARPGQIYTIALALGSTPGIPLSVLGPPDPRVLQLNPDALFFLSLTPNPAFLSFVGVVGTTGDIHARIALGPIPGLSGTPFYAGGWILGTAPFELDELLPTVPLAFP